MVTHESSRKSSSLIVNWDHLKTTTCWSQISWSFPVIEFVISLVKHVFVSPLWKLPLCKVFYYFLHHLCFLILFQCLIFPGWPLSSRPVSWLVWSVCCHGATGGRIEGWWGCHSKLSKEKREGGDLALGHPHPSCSLSDRSHHMGDLPGGLTTQWGGQRQAFTSTISRLQSLDDTTKYPSTTTPKLFFFLPSPFLLGWTVSS